MPCFASIAACAFDAAKSSRHSLLSKPIDALISRISAAGPPAKRPPHIKLVFGSATVRLPIVAPSNPRPRVQGRTPSERRKMHKQRASSVFCGKCHRLRFPRAAERVILVPWGDGGRAMNKMISSKHLEGVSDLTLAAPIKQGFIDAFESVT